MWFGKVATAGALALALAAASGPAHAQPQPDPGASEEELAAARQLFTDGKVREVAKDWSGALEIMERVAQVRLSPNVRYHIALCHEHLGRLVEAVNGYELATQEARSAGKEAAEVLENAPPRAAALRKQLGAIRIVVTGELRTSKVLLDGKGVLRAFVGSALPVNPGAHTVQLESGGKVVEERAVTLDKGGLERVEFEVHDPEVVEPPPGLPPLHHEPDKPEGEAGMAPGRVAAYVLGATGLGSLVISGVLWGLRERDVAEVRASCDPNDAFCDPALETVADRAFGYQNGSLALVGVGAASLVTGLVLFFALPAEDTPAPDVPPPPAALDVGVSPRGLLVRGRF